MSLDVLIVDDESDIRELVSDILKDQGFAIRSAASSDKALKLIAEKVPSLIILDIWLQGSDLDGLGVLEIVKQKYPLLPVIIISGHGTIDTAVSAIKLGAYDYLEKPFTQDKLIVMIKRAYEAAKLKRENIELKSKVLDKSEFIGCSSHFLKMKSEIEKVSSTSSRVMLHGPVGSGKELVARLIHKQSKRASAPFVIFNPGSLSNAQVMHDLFGDYDKSLPHSSLKRHSMLEASNGGTLYIDEVGDLPLVAQGKLLKFLHDATLDIPSKNQTVKLDVRFVTSTTKNLLNLVAQGKFREDLYYRLNIVQMNIPSLSERIDDIPLLVKFFIKQLVKFSGLKEREFANDAISSLQSYQWPGNVRQLRNIVEWTLIMTPIVGNADNIIKSEMLPAEILNHSSIISKPEHNVDIMSMPLREAREIFERQYLHAQMTRFNNNISKTSNFVGMERSALHRKLKLLSINGYDIRAFDNIKCNEQI